MYNNNNDFLPSNSKYFHIALIPDGGRRWAKKHHLSYYESYTLMVEKMTEAVKYLFTNEVDIISVYFSSVYNFKRTCSEIQAFNNAETVFFDKIIPIARLYDIAVIAVGETSVLDKKMISAIKRAEALTRVFTSRKLFVCINYSSLNEISKAMDKSNGRCFVNYLDIPYPVNLLIRTGNASVLSDFLLPQCACARLVFLENLFNDITTDDYAYILNEYRDLKLKYGE